MKKYLICILMLLSTSITTVFAMPTNTTMPSSTTLHETGFYTATRQGRHFIVHLKEDHQVLSTSDINGGQTNTLKYIVNFQSVEASGHDERFNEILSQTNEQYHQALAKSIDIDPEFLALMGTAANINNVVHIQEEFRDITVDAFVTAGVKGNALRAGDRTHWYQGRDGNEFIKDVSSTFTEDSLILVNDSDMPVKDSFSVKDSLPPVKDSGTINIVLMVNRSLTPGALAKSAVILTEAKSAALAELAISSTVSQHLATGTGTDQYAIASPIKSEFNALDSASGHLKLGELIGSAVRKAVIQAISLQNGLERSDTRSVVHALKRFGATGDYLLSELEKRLNKSNYLLLKKNKKSLFRDAKLVATAYAYAALLDRLEYQTLSNNIQNDVLLDQAVNAAIAISGKSQYWQQYRQKFELNSTAELDLFIQAVAIGWESKWAK